MKNIVRKSMFVLSFLGLFTFVAPKQAKADSSPGWPRSCWVCCPNGSCHCCLLEKPSDYWIYYELWCGGDNVVVNK